MVVHGADADELDRVATEVAAAGARLTRSRSSLTPSVVSAPWLGVVGDAFRRQFHSEHARALASAASFLEETARELRRQAAEQRRAHGASGGATAWAAAAAGNSTAGEMSTSSYLKELAALKPGEIALRDLGDGKYVLLLRGMEVRSLGDNGPVQVGADYAGGLSSYQVRIRALLDSLPDGSEVGVIAHSQGGLAAMEVADHEAITHLLVLGSPIDHKSVPPGVHVLAVENRDDEVPYLDAWPLAETAEALSDPRRLAVSVLPLAPLTVPLYDSLVGDGGPSGPANSAMHVSFTSPPGDDHGVTASYVPAIEAIEGSSSAVTFTDDAERQYAAAYLDAFQERYGGGPESTWDPRWRASTGSGW